MKGGSTTERKQFTFYRSFYEAVSRIRRKSVRADVYDAMCRYALNGEKPDLENLPPEGAVALMLIMPVLESGRKKAAAAYKSNADTLQSDCNPSAKPLQTHCKKENEKENKKEVEKETEKEISLGAVGDIADFDQFWKAYPKKVGKQDAREAFSKVNVPLKTLLDALCQQDQSAQWNRDGGRFIPNPATWLKQKRWEDELPPLGGVPKGASGILGQAELESIQRMLKEG